MITVHHLNDSLPYEIEQYQRDPRTRLAPLELKNVHPLGKSPVITDGGHVVAESGAIIEYILRHHGGGQLRPDSTAPEFDDYLHWMHYAEGSAMAALILKITVDRLGEGGARIAPRLDSEMTTHLEYINSALEGREYLSATLSLQRTFR